MSSNTCVRCSAIIPSGRNYCAPHYQEALLEYEEARENYEISYQNYLAEVEEWNEMSVEERNVYHKHAESESLSTISVVAGLSGNHRSDNRHSSSFEEVFCSVNKGVAGGFDVRFGAWCCCFLWLNFLGGCR